MILFLISFGMIPIGLIIKVNDWIGGGTLITLGLFGLSIYYMARTTKDLIKNRNDKLNIILQILLVLMSIILYTRYQFYRFGDYPGLIIVPSFILTSLLYLIKGKTRDIKLTITSIAYLLLSIPLFGLEFHKSPRQYIPQEWYNRFGTKNDVSVILPYRFENKVAEKLSVEAFDLRKSKQFSKAIDVYKQALIIEPNNPKLLFDISSCYSMINDLESAISVLDKAILIDSTFAGFYNNRGLNYYKLKADDKAIKDYQKAIQLDSTQWIFFANIALVYYYENDFNNSCESIKTAERLGMDLSNVSELERIKRKKCE